MTAEYAQSGYYSEARKTPVIDRLKGLPAYVRARMEMRKVRKQTQKERDKYLKPHEAEPERTFGLGVHIDSPMKRMVSPNGQEHYSPLDLRETITMYREFLLQLDQRGLRANPGFDPESLQLDQKIFRFRPGWLEATIDYPLFSPTQVHIPHDKITRQQRIALEKEQERIWQAASVPIKLHAQPVRIDQGHQIPGGLGYLYSEGERSNYLVTLTPAEPLGIGREHRAASHIMQSLLATEVLKGKTDLAPKGRRFGLNLERVVSANRPR